MSNEVIYALSDSDEDTFMPSPKRWSQKSQTQRQSSPVASFSTGVIDLTAEQSSEDEHLVSENLAATNSNADAHGSRANSDIYSGAAEHYPDFHHLDYGDFYNYDAWDDGASTDAKNNSDNEETTQSPNQEKAHASRAGAGLRNSAANHRLSESEEDVGWPPKHDKPDSDNELELSQNSMKSFHPISDSDQSDDEPPPTKRKGKTTAPRKMNGTSSGPAQTKRRKRTVEEREAEVAAKEGRKRQREELRRLRPEHCLKYLVMEVESSLVALPQLSALLEGPPISGLRHRTTDHAAPYSITWARELSETDANNDKPREQVCDQLLQVLPMDMVEPLIQFNQLPEHASSLQEQFSRVAFIVLGSQQYFKDHKSKKKTSNHITRGELQEAIVECQVERQVTIRLAETAQEVGDWLFRYTKAVAEQPFKASKGGWQANFRFHLSSEKGQGLRVGSASSLGLPQLWLHTLKKIRRATLEMCQAITAAYPSPAALVQAYEDCEREDEARNLLQNLVVQRGVGALAAQRRVGPVLSRKVHTLLMATQPTITLAD